MEAPYARDGAPKPGIDQRWLRRDERSRRYDKRIIWSDDLPKTRSGKIMRRLLKDIAEGRELGDATTLRDPAIVESIKRSADRQLGRT